MFKEIAQLGSLLKQAQSLSGKMQEAQQRLATSTFEGQAADGRVRIYLSGQGRLTGCRIDPSLLTPERQSVIHDAIITATNEALDVLKQRTAEELGDVTGGLDLGALGNALGFPPKTS